MILSILFFLVALVSSKKILCLHGGGQTPGVLENSSGMQALMASLPDYQFVFAEGGYAQANGRVWIPDPPNGKGTATTDPNWSQDSIAALDALVDSEGPFYGILGYSQGSAYVPVYLAHAPANTFEVAIMFCGYLTETHTGILNTVNAASPFNNIPALVWMGTGDYIISNDQTRAQAEKFTNPFTITSRTGAHDIPSTSDTTYVQVVSFITSNGTAIGEPSADSSASSFGFCLLIVLIVRFF